MGTPSPPSDASFGSRLRSAAVAARIGAVLGVCFGIAFLTGLVSHYAQNVVQPIPFPTSPSWGYRVNQGLHVTTGTACVPLLLVKLWTVYPQLFRRPPSGLRRLAVEMLERASIGVLVASAIFQLASGLANVTEWYPWNFSFRPTHYALAWVAIGSLLVPIAVKLPIIRGAHHRRRGLRRRPTRRHPAVSALPPRSPTSNLGGHRDAVLATTGNTVPLPRRISVFAPHSGTGVTRVEAAA